jgi:cbb3-type cytochrome c oxidase subunit III
MKRTLLIATLFAGLFISVNAQAANPISAFEGQRLFISHCQLCHGPDAKGNGPLAQNLGINPVDLTRTIRSRSETMLRRIISGQGGPTVTGRDRHNLLTDAMPDWGKVFSDDQIDALIAYLKYLGTAKHNLMGDPRQGYELYQQYCAVCHGEDGYGDGVMTQIMDLEPMDHTNPVVMNSMSNEELITAILEGNGEYMPAWNGILERDEVEALVSYIRLLTQ